MDPVKAPFLMYEDVSAAAGELLERYGLTSEIPIDIEAIVEFHLGMDIIPCRGMMDRDEVDGFLSLDLTAINVDEGGLTEHSRSVVAGHIAKKFWVSTIVVHKRLREVGIW